MEKRYRNLGAKITGEVLLGICLLVMVSFGIPAIGSAQNEYIIADADIRKLTEDELLEWDYESLGYIQSEILARNGFAFETGNPFFNYFSLQEWYNPGKIEDNSLIMWTLSNEAQTNVALIDDLRNRMQMQKIESENSKSIWDSVNADYEMMQGFRKGIFQDELTFSVYAAPSYSAWRSADGKASVSTLGDIYYYGDENGWLMILYETNNGKVRVGWIDLKGVNGDHPVGKSIVFANEKAKIKEKVKLTDDPATGEAEIKILHAGDEVTYLSTFFYGDAWAYVETEKDGKTVRGFVPQQSLEMVPEVTSDNEFEEVG